MSPIIFAGILMGRNGSSPWNILLPQSHYSSELKNVQLSDYVSIGRILESSKLWVVVRPVSGAHIWLRLSRRDIGFGVTKIATDDVPFCHDAVMDLQTLSLCNKAVRYVRNYDREPLYAPTSSSSESLSTRLGKLRKLRLDTSPDAGFGTPPKADPLKGPSRFRLHYSRATA